MQEIIIEKKQNMPSNYASVIWSKISDYPQKIYSVRQIEYCKTFEDAKVVANNFNEVAKEGYSYVQIWENINQKTIY